MGLRRQKSGLAEAFNWKASGFELKPSMYGASWMPGTALVALHILYLIFPATFQVDYSPHSRTEEAEAPAVIFFVMVLGSGLVH